MIIIVCELLRTTGGMLGWERSKRQSEFLKKKKRKKLAEKKFGSTYETCKPHHWEERQQH